MLCDDSLCVLLGGKFCSIEGCEKQVQRRGKCKVHGNCGNLSPTLYVTSMLCCLACYIVDCCCIAWCSVFEATAEYSSMLGDDSLCVLPGEKKLCSIEGCEMVVQKGGKCRAHGNCGNLSPVLL